MPERTPVASNHALASALGRALLGERAECSLSPEELERARPTLRRAAAIRTPLVVSVRPGVGPWSPGTTSRDALLFGLAEDDGFAVLFDGSDREGRNRARRLAEAALLPVIVASAADDLEQDPARTGLPEAGEQIPSPGGVQKLLFGERRRRVPIRLESDRGSSLGAALDSALLEATRISARLWTDRELAELWRATDLSEPVLRGAASDVRLVTTLDRLDAAAAALEGQGVQVVGLPVANPWLDEALREALEGARQILALEDASGPAGTFGPLAGKLARLAATLRGRGLGRRRDPLLRSAVVGRAGIAPEELRTWVSTAENRPPVTWLGFAPGAAGASPRRWALADQLERDLPELHESGIRAEAPSGEVSGEVSGEAPAPPSGSTSRTASVPPAARRLAFSGGPPLQDLAAFRERLELAHPAPEPVLGAGTLPPGAGLLSRPERAGPPPIWNAEACEANGACWTACPDDAFTPWVTDSRALLETLSDVDLSVLRPSLSRWAQEIETVAAGEPDLESVLEAAWTATEPTLPEARRESARAAARRVAARARGLLQTRPRRLGGRWLALPIDPERCTGCGLCVAECPTGALRPRDPAEPPPTLPAPELVDGLPSPTIEESDDWAREGVLPPLTAALLRRAAREVLLGPGSGGPGDGVRTGLRQALGLLRDRSDRERAALRTRLEELRRAVAGKIHEHLEGALPDDDLDRLAAGLEGLARADLDLADLASRVERGVQARRLDAGRLQRQVALARRLADLEHRLGTDHHPFLHVVATAELATAPAPLLAAPSIAADPEEAFGVARGLVEALAAETATDRELVAEAEALVGRRGADSVAGDLREGRPLVTVILSEHDLRSRVPEGLLDVLSGNLEIVVVLLADPGPWTGSPLDLPALAVATGGCVFAQASSGAPRQLFESLEAIRDARAGVLRLHVPRPTRDGFPTDGALQRARDAIGARVFPLVRMTPGRKIGPSPPILDGNPEPSEDWSEGRTPIDWAAGEERLRSLFAPADGAGPSAREVLDHLDATGEPAGVGAPVLEGPDGGFLRARPPLIQWAAERWASWRFLRSLGAPAADPAATGQAEEPPTAPETRPDEREIEQRVVERLRRRLRVLAGGGGST